MCLLDDRDADLVCKEGLDGIRCMHDIPDSVPRNTHRTFPGYQERRCTKFEIFADRRYLPENIVTDDNIPWQLHPFGLVKNLRFE